MSNRENILIKDPYLRSAEKNNPNRSYSVTRVPAPPTPHSSYLKQQNENLKSKLNFYERDISTLQRAVNDRENISQKLLNLQTNNNEYYESMKLRNLDLNNKLNDLALEKELIQQHHLGLNYKHSHDKDILIRRYQEQTEEMLSLKRALASSMEHKEQLESEVSHLAFVLEKQTTKMGLQLREQLIRMENMERTYKSILSTKDEEINSLHHRLKAYEDDNRRLVELNRTLQLTKNEKINNLSRIPDMDSNIKSHIGRSIQKQNYNPNIRDEIQNERRKNDQLQKQIERLKKEKIDYQKQNERSRSPTGQKHSNTLDLAKTEGLIGSIVTLRNGVNKEVFDVFFKSIREGEKRRQNSLVIFITNWKNLDIERLRPYVQSYLQSRGNLKQIILNVSSKGHPLLPQMEQCIPLHVSSRKGRSKINQWILSTVQFTKNQRETGKKSLNNLLLFLFRLLTIQYRITYPMQGKSFTVDGDVRNELLHETVKAIRLLLQYK